MGFLVPGSDERALIARKAEARSIAKKKTDKVSAEKRKRDKELLKNRSAQITAALSNPAPPPASPPPPEVPPLPPCPEPIRRFLAQPIFFGQSGFDSKERVKLLCGAGTKRWCGETKLWGTTAPSQLVPLLSSGLWTPVGLEKRFFRGVLDEIGARAAHAVATQQAKARAVTVEREKQREKLLEADKADQRKRLAAEEAEAKREAAAAAAAAALKLREQNEADANERALAATGVPLTRAVGVLPTAEEVVACTALGFSSEAIERTARLTWLGLCSGLSLEARLLRMAAIVEFHARDAGGHYFLPELYLPAQTASVHAFVARVLAETR